MTNLDEMLLEQQLNDFLQDGQQAGVMHPNASLQQGQQALNEVQLPIFFL